MTKSFSILLLFVFLIPVSYSQEVLTGITVNELIKNKSPEIKKKCGCKGESKESALHLPFLERFSGKGVFPDESKWEDKNVFINQSFPFRSVDHGVATFDALNSNGEMYDDANWVSFKADYLTSKTIRTDSVFEPVAKKLEISDSLYLSFFYQPQGRGDEPEPWDSLVLQFGYPSGDTVFSHMDSIDVLVDYYLQLYNTDTIFPGDTLWAPPGCNPNVFSISYTYLSDPNAWVKVPCDSVFVPEIKWQTVWQAEGMKLIDFQKKYKRNFVQVLIPLDSSKFLSPLFRFRFYNIASIASDIVPSWKSNCDQWNIDRVYLNYGRSIDDTAYQEVAFADRAPSFLRRYRAMPYRQYVSDAYNSISESFKMYYNNLDNIPHQVNYRYVAKRIGGDEGYSYPQGGLDFTLQPYSAEQFSDTLEPWKLDAEPCQEDYQCPFVGQYFPLYYDIDSMSYLITHYLEITDPGGTQYVDSVSSVQGFYNYYAYDDGVPELGYSVVPAGAQCAYKFTVNKPDTLRGVQIYFNRTVDNANEVYFKLKVWRDNNGVPGQVIYSEENVKVKWNTGTIYGFYYYKFTEPVVVQGDFYVGWEQYQNVSLNIGFDADSDENDKIFYTLDGDWQQSSFHGALLIRPVVGFKGFVGIEENTSGNGLKFNVYPNPAAGVIRFDKFFVSNSDADRLVIIDLFGRKVKSVSLNNNVVDVSLLPPGFYIVNILKGGKSYTSRFLKK